VQIVVNLAQLYKKLRNLELQLAIYNRLGIEVHRRAIAFKLSPLAKKSRRSDTRIHGDPGHQSEMVSGIADEHKVNESEVRADQQADHIGRLSAPQHDRERDHEKQDHHKIIVGSYLWIQGTEKSSGNHLRASVGLLSHSLWRTGNQLV